MATFERVEHSGNAVLATLTGTVNSADTSLSLVDATGWPTGGTGPFYLVIDPGTTSEEKIKATSRSGTTLSGLVRGVDGTVAVSHTPVTGAVQHIFTAVEADEANQAAHATIGQVTTLGDMLIGSASKAIGRLPIGANNDVLVADNSQPFSVKWGPITSTILGAGTVLATNITAGAVTTPALAAGAVTAPAIAAGAVGQAKLDPASIVVNVFDVTDTGTGDAPIPHGASFTPRAAFVSFTRPTSFPGTVIGGVITSYDATNVNMRLTIRDTGNIANALPNHSHISGCVLSFA